MGSLSALFEKVLRLFVEVSTGCQLSLEQWVCLINDVVFVVSSLLPLVNTILQTRFGRPIVEFDKLEKMLLVMQDGISDTFSADKLSDFVSECLHFDKADYKAVIYHHTQNSISQWDVYFLWFLAATSCGEGKGVPIRADHECKNTPGQKCLPH